VKKWKFSFLTCVIIYSW